MWISRVFLFSFVLITPILAICKESDFFVFRCESWEDVMNLSQKPTISQLAVNGTGPSWSLVCDEKTLKDFRDLSIIYVSPGSFSSIDKDCFMGLKALRYVQFIENALSSVALDSLNGSIVERLWLDGNKLKELKFDNITLPVLRSLGLSINLLTEISIDPTSLPDLQILDLSFNNLTKVNVESLTLSYLKLRGNLLTELSADNIKGKSVRMLYLSENKLTEIRGPLFANVPRVEFVHFEKNPIKLIDFSNFNITSLRCTDKLMWMSKRNRNAPLSVDVSWDQVQQLILSNNSLDRLDIFQFAPENQTIGELRLDHNLIREIRRPDLKPFTGLVVVDLSNNRINSIEDGAFEGLLKLHSLSLANNCIHGMSDHMFQGLNSLFALDLSQNIMTYFVVTGWNSMNNSISLTQYHVRHRIHTFT